MQLDSLQMQQHLPQKLILFFSTKQLLFAKIQDNRALRKGIYSLQANNISVIHRRLKMSSDASWKRDLHSAYKVQMLVRALRKACLFLLGLCFFCFLYMEVSMNVIPENLVHQMRR